jgi:hypothetical protein
MSDLTIKEAEALVSPPTKRWHDDSCSKCAFFSKGIAYPDSRAGYSRDVAVFDPTQGYCMRYPEPLLKDIDHWCGEFQ